MKLPVLVVDDDDHTRKSLGELLDRKEYQVHLFNRGDDLVQLIKDLDRPVVVLVDVDLPGMSGIDVLLAIDRIQKDHPDRFIVPYAMSGKFTESKDIIQAKKVGAKDFLAKPIVPEELFALLENAREALKRAVERQEILLKDDLTGFYRQKEGRERLAEEISRARRFDRSVAVVFLDLDDFKKVNDTYGHLVGSELLKLLAGRINDVKRTYDIGVRFGGDEIVLILPETDRRQAEKEARRIWRHISKNPFVIHGNTIKVTVSVGVAIGTGLGADELIHRADTALYAAKRKGKNRVSVFSAKSKKTFELTPKDNKPPA